MRLVVAAPPGVQVGHDVHVGPIASIGSVQDLPTESSRSVHLNLSGSSQQLAATRPYPRRCSVHQFEIESIEVNGI